VSGDQIDDPDGPLFARPGLVELFLTGAHRALRELALHDVHALIDLGLVGAGAVSPQQELGHVCGHRVAPLKGAHQVLAHDETLEGFGSQQVQRIELHGRCS